MIGNRPWALLLLATLVNLSSAAPPPGDAATALPRMSAPQLSPDARYVAFLAREGDRRVLKVIDVERDDDVTPVLDHGKDESYTLDWYGWINSERLLCGYHASTRTGGVAQDLSRLVAVNTDGSDPKVVMQSSRAGGDERTRPRVLDWTPRELKTVKLEVYEDGEDYPSVFKFDLYSGKLEREVKPQAPIRYFATERRDYEVVLGWGEAGDELQYFRRVGRWQKKWQRLTRVRPTSGPGALRPLPDRLLGNIVHALGKHEGRDAVWNIDLDDTEEPRLYASSQGADGASALNTSDGGLLGITYRTDPSATVYFGGSGQRATELVAERLPAQVIRVVDEVDNPHRFVMWVLAKASEPSRYYLFDVGADELRELGTAVP